MFLEVRRLFSDTYKLVEPDWWENGVGLMEYNKEYDEENHFVECIY